MPYLSKRIPLGGLNHTELLQKALGLKFPQHRLTQDNFLEIQFEHTYCAKNYKKQI